MQAEQTGAENLEQARGALMAVAALVLAVMLLLPPLLGFTVDFASFTPLFSLIAVPAIALPFVYWRDLRRLRAPLEATALGLLLTLPAIVFTFCAARAGLPIADRALIWMDAALGFDWPAFVRLLDQSAVVARLLALAYDSFSLQLLFLPTVLCMAGLAGRAYRFVLCYILLVCLACILGALLPSEGTFVAFGFERDTLVNLDSKFGFLFLSSFHGVRGDADFVLSFATAAGIISFPSIHAGVGLLCAWATWPSRLLRVPVCILNGAMTVAAIPYGAHYLADIVFGLGTACAAICLSARLIA